MFDIIITLNGDYNSYLKWDLKFDYNNILRDFGVVLIGAFNEECKVMDNYKARWMCAGDKTIDLEDLKSKLDENIRAFLKTNSELEEFTLDKVEIK